MTGIVTCLLRIGAIFLMSGATARPAGRPRPAPARTAVVQAKEVRRREWCGPGCFHLHDLRPDLNFKVEPTACEWFVTSGEDRGLATRVAVG
jgi:hypothetical protein